MSSDKSSTRSVSVLVNGERYDVEILERTRNSVSFQYGKRNYLVEFVQEVADKASPSSTRSPGKTAIKSSRHVSNNPGELIAPIPGVVIGVLVSVGDTVAEGDVVLRLEAMKMENNIFAPKDGVIEAIEVAVGDEVSDHQLLLRIK